MQGWGTVGLLLVNSVTTIMMSMLRSQDIIRKSMPFTSILRCQLKGWYMVESLSSVTAIAVYEWLVVEMSKQTLFFFPPKIMGKVPVNVLRVGCQQPSLG